MPLFFFKKVIFVEKPTLSVDDLATMSQQTSSTVQEIQTSVPIDWFQIVAIGYGIIVAVLLVKIIANLASLFQLLNKQQIIKREQFALVDLNENVAPFSFFNFIVFNSSLYSEEELQSILLHEKVHSQQKHSIDILIAKLFCTVFWFNPFVWLYKKAITQNLEYIADQKAIQLIADKKAYQKALLKVVSHQNCLSITNHFYQSLIKKRIVMLNKNQSNKRSSWKYAVVIPALIAFVFLFQIKVVAQEKAEKEPSKAVSAIAVGYSTDKNATDEEMKNDTKTAKEQLGIDYKFSNVKRNDKGEIIAIKIEYKTKEGKSGKIELDSDNPIETIYFNADGDKVGFSKNDFLYSSDQNNKTVSISYDDAIKFVGGNNENAATAIAVPNYNDAAFVTHSEAMENRQPNTGKVVSVVTTLNLNTKAIIVLDGTIIEGDTDKIINIINPDNIESMNVIKEENAIKTYGEKGKNGGIEIITKENINPLISPSKKEQVRKDEIQARKDEIQARKDAIQAKKDLEQAKKK